MPLSIHSYATNSAADLGGVTSPLRPLTPHLQTSDDNVISWGRGGGGLIQCPYNTLRSLDKSTTERKKIAGRIFNLYKIYGAFHTFF